VTNFVAKEKGELYPVQPPKTSPIREPLPKVADGTAVNHYYFRDKAATVAEVSAPGFFDFMRDTFRSGGQKGVVHMITAHLGEVAEGLTEVTLHLVDAPTQFSGPVVMAVADTKRYKPATKPK
jgi:hypothetical protein